MVENECIKRKLVIVSQVLEVVAAEESVTKKKVELQLVLSAKDTKIIHLKL